MKNWTYITQETKPTEADIVDPLRYPRRYHFETLIAEQDGQEHPIELDIQANFEFITIDPPLSPEAIPNHTQPLLQLDRQGIQPDDDAPYFTILFSNLEPSRLYRLWFLAREPPRPIDGELPDSPTPNLIYINRTPEDIPQIQERIWGGLSVNDEPGISTINLQEQRLLVSSDSNGNIFIQIRPVPSDFSATLSAFALQAQSI
jgi:hypothetical protein